MDRRAEILKHVTKDKKGIEIGPWFAPLAPKREGYNCLSFDVFDTETLKKNAEQDPHIDNSRIASIESVDVVGGSTEIQEIIAARGALGTFDYIISSHNFEHLPNPIKFLQGCEKVLKPGGYLSMAIPDKRCCFDYFKAISTLGAWLEAHIKRRDRPTPTQVFEQNCLHSRYYDSGLEQIGFSILDDPRKVVALKTLREAYGSFVAQNDSDDSTYYDTHCWAFTPSSMHLLLLDIAFLGLTGFRVEEISDTNGVEFYVHLCNSGIDRLESEVFYNKRQNLLHAVVNENSFNSIYAYTLRDNQRSREQELLSEIAVLQDKLTVIRTELKQLRDQNAFQENAVRDIKGTITWKAISPLWRLETRGRRKSRRQGRLTDVCVACDVSQSQRERVVSGSNTLKLLGSMFANTEQFSRDRQNMSDRLAEADRERRNLNEVVGDLKEQVNTLRAAAAIRGTGKDDRTQAIKAAYERHVSKLQSQHDEREAMSLAVGGDFENVGKIELALLQHFGLQPDNYLIDVGCGSGRLAKPLASYLSGHYSGFDVVADLVEFARKNSGRPDWRFALIDHIEIPELDRCADMVCFFSVLTHLLHEQSYWYLEEAIRVLKPGGRVVFSFLDFAEAAHWSIFNTTLQQAKDSLDVPINVFISKEAIKIWALHLNLQIDAFVGATEAVVQAGALGQSLCVLKKL